jgi:hypothetical protein
VFMPAVIPEYFTVKESSKILGFSTNSIYKFLKVGRLKGARGSQKQGRFRITKTSIETFLGSTLTEEFIQSRLSPNTPSTQIAAPQVTQAVPSTPAPPVPTQPLPLASKPTPNNLPLHLTRTIIILALIAIILDMLLSANFSLTQQLVRLSIITALILVTYQYGDQSSPTHQDTNHPSQP